jgi:hypothetical protein
MVYMGWLNTTSCSSTSDVYINFIFHLCPSPRSHLSFGGKEKENRSHIEKSKLYLKIKGSLKRRNINFTKIIWFILFLFNFPSCVPFVHRWVIHATRKVDRDDNYDIDTQGWAT